jgi:hypothetical protein
MPDFLVRNDGSIISFQPVSDEAKAWVKEHVEIPSWATLGPWVCCDHRQGAGVLHGAHQAGFAIERYQPSMF